jgi:hypothetical protein
MAQMSDTTSTSTYWTEIARHPEGYVLFDSLKKSKPPWIRLKLMRPQVPGRRIARRVWLCWNADEQRMSRSPFGEEAPFAKEAPRIYAWVLDVMEGLAARETSSLTRSPRLGPRAP